jgi:murein DD-endopeptidase MepM/ murein hydrolase activator NlpD
MKRFGYSLGPGSDSSAKLGGWQHRRRLTWGFPVGIVIGSTIAVGSLVDLPRQVSIRAVGPAEAAEVAVGSMWNMASFPVENFQAYTSPFGYREDPYGGGQRFHYGLDLAAPMGSYIRNWWEGKVIEVSDDSACGTSVVVQSGNWMHIYCHMQGYVVSDGSGRYMVDTEGGLQIREGQTVGTGTRIGRIGMTGRTTGPHLHWGLKYDDNWVDPALVLRAMYSSQQAALQTN